jgi:hypothetical protein
LDGRELVLIVLPLLPLMVSSVADGPLDSNVPIHDDDEDEMGTTTIIVPAEVVLIISLPVESFFGTTRRIVLQAVKL